MDKPKRKSGPPPWVTLIRWISLVLAVALAFVPSRTAGDFQELGHIYFHLDPLLALGIILTQWVIPEMLVLALITLLITIALGRVFCGYICPLGGWLDISGTRKGSRSNRSLSLNWRYILLFSFLILALFGFPLLYLLDPITIFYRNLTLAAIPLGGKVAATVAAQLSQWVELPQRSGGFWGWLSTMAQSPAGVRFYLLGLFAVIVFVGITLLERLSSRFWCRYLCPLGATLSLFSRLNLLRRRVDEKVCTECQACSKVCPMGAIGEKGLTTDFSLCFNCKECKRRCTSQAISFRWGFPEPASAAPLDLSRRAMFGSLGLAGLAAASARLSLFSFSKTDFIRPPGALPEAKFIGRCVGCMRCVEVCPTNIIVPTDLRRGLTTFYTPRLDFARQGCAQDCVACTNACPTGALMPLELEVKSFLKLGSTYVDRGKCLAWSQGQICLVCKESCPYGAIAAKLDKTPFGDNLVPAPDRSRCIGCGTCEANCPVRGRPAIIVIPDGEDRALEQYPPGEKILKIRRRRRSQFIEDDVPPMFGDA